MEAQLVQPPIPESAAEKMSDEQWLSSIHKYDTDDRDFTQDDHFVGGALELSRVSGKQSKERT